MKYLNRFYLVLALALAACGGEPFTGEKAASAGPDGGGAPIDGTADAGPEATTDAPDGATFDGAAAGDGIAEASAAEDQSRPATDAGAGDVAELLDAGGDVDAEAVDAEACDPNYGDASPGGPCCVHVWASPSMGGVLCTVDGSRWCWQTGMPCSAIGSRCVVQGGVSYCAP